MLGGVAELDAGAWNALLGDPAAGASPFVEHAFLTCLEDAGTLGKKQGWIPKIITLWKGRRLVAAAPAYVKLHSQGEFVFDFAFADLASRLGVRYYPKLLVGVPFTPATGRRLLTGAGSVAERAVLMEVLGRALLSVAKELGCSGVHVNFALEEEIAALVALGFEERWGVQYHWYREGAATFDDYLSRFNSKRRNQLKRERRALEEGGVSIEVVRGTALDDAELMRLAFELYRTTVDKFYWGRQYLNEAVFRLFAQRMQHAMELVLARRSDGKPVAGAINFAGATRLYGRYWGTLEEERFLHFNVCYYAGVEECVRRGLDVFEPGAGGEHKLARGFEPTVTRSAHYLMNPILFDPIRRYLRDERAAIAAENPRGQA